MLPLLLACAGSTTDPFDVPEAGPLHADGTRLVDDDGRVATLHGVNTGGRAKFAPYLPYESGTVDDYLDRAEAWGVDVLRVPFVWAALEPTEGDDDEAWLADYDALLDGAAARGMWTIVDAHQDIWSEVYCGDGFPAWTVADPPDPHHDCPDWFNAYLGADDDVTAAFDTFWDDSTGVQTAFGAMWDRMAAHEAGRDGVLGFELLNEPFHGSMDEATWGETVYAPFVEALADRVRAEAPDQLVFFDATGLDAIDQAPAFPRPSGDGLVFAPHYYDPTAFLGGTPDPDAVHDALARWAELGATWNLPILIGEAGVDNDSSGAGTYADAVWSAVDDLGLGLTWWEYSVATESWNGEDMDLVEPDGTEVDALVDALARPYAALLAGDDLVTDTDGTVWTFAWTPTDGGVTELRWPTRLGAVTAEVEGGAAQVVGGRVYVQADDDVDTVLVTLTPPL